MARSFSSTLILVAIFLAPAFARAQVDPATEPSVLAVNKVWPAVVNISTERVLRRTYQDPYDTLFNQFFGGPMRRPRELQQKVQSLGSGFLIDPSGYIVTNEHVVERAADMKIQVVMSDGKSYVAKYIAGDSALDIAFIKIEGKTPFGYISLDDLSPTLVGETVLAVGNPLGYGLAVSRGILSAVKRTITIDEFEYKDLIQTDAAINPGNSGGPIIDLSGKLVAMSSVKMAYTPQGVPTQGLGFGIPGPTVRDKVREFMSAARNPAVAKNDVSKSAARRLFGLQLQDLTPALSEAFGLASSAGALIADVEEGSPAQAAGLRRGLVVLKVGRYAVKSASHLDSLLDRGKSGTAADFVVGYADDSGQTKLTTVSLTAR
ncbi:MAG: trypsin-like peptidase domain-containing protein [Verrucomicrobiota bacterium]|nr:trypsin-like peptidase domain-containing protein [Verrucomicrobiota bacterium]